MATTNLWNDLSHLLKSFWVFLCALCRRRDDSTTVLPIASLPPIPVHEIIINICAPPEDLPVLDAYSIASLLNNSWTTNNQEFPRADPRYQDENYQRRLVVSEISIPDIHIQNWEDPWPKSQDTHKQSPNLLASATSSDIHAVPAAMDFHATPLPLPLTVETSTFPDVSLEPFVMDAVSSSPEEELVESRGCPQLNLTLDVGDEQRQISNTEPPISGSVAENFTATFEPIKYPYSALSAVSECNLWDVPSYDAARMVSLPLYTSTPPRSRSQLSTKPTDTRLSLLSYAELFDFSMYNSRISQDNPFVDFSFGCLPPDVTTPLAPPAGVDPIPHFLDINHQGSARSPMNSKSTTSYIRKSATPVKLVLASSRFSSSDRIHLREISSNFGTFNSPLNKRTSSVSFTSNFRDSSFSVYSQSSASSLNLSKSPEDFKFALNM